MPLLGLLIEVKEATPALTLLAMGMSILIVGRDWRQADWRALRSLVVGSLFGIPLGVFLLAEAPQEPIVNGLACVVILFALFRLLWKRPLPIRPNLGWDLGLSFASGALGAAFGIGGPPIIAYASLRDWDPPTFRATMHALSLATGVFVLAGHGAAGLWTADVLRLAACGLPMMVLGVLVGGSLNSVLDLEKFRAVVYVVLTILGVLLLVT